MVRRSLLLFVLSSPSARAQAPAPPESAEERAIEPPIAKDAAVSYPPDATGTEVVLLELVVEADGSVSSVSVVSGDEPFASAARRAALAWRFEPAQLHGAPTRAKIRFEVRFVPPVDPKQLEPRIAIPEPPEESDAPPRPSAPQPVQEVVIEGDRPEGEHRLSRAEVRQLPGTFGDAFRAIETLPGVTPIVSGLPYFYVRGAPPGNVGYFLDGIRVPLLFHIAAGPSVIHPAFIDTVELYPGPYPARYGRFAGGIVAGETAPPQYQHRGEASIRLVDAGGMVETHVFDRRLDVMLAGRYSYFALIGSLLSPDLNLSYWDYQGRIQYRLNPRESITLFAFGALDKASEQRPGPNVTIFDLVFHRFDLRYDRNFDDGAHFRAAVLYGSEVSGLEQFSLHDRLMSGRLEYEKPLSKKLQIRSGADFQVDRHKARFDSDEEEVADEDLSADFFPPRYDIATGIRTDFVWLAETGVRVIPGMRFDFFIANKKPLWAVSPRIYAEFDIRRNITLKHGFGVAHQLPSFVVPLPGLQPVGTSGLQRALQHSAGVEWRLPEGVTAEATFFQNIQLNLTDQFSAIRFDEAEDAFEDDLRAQGSGRGFELMIRRSLTRRLGGYLSYTLSRSTRSLGSQKGPSSFDRTHVLGAALGYQAGKGWIFGGRGSFYTGIPAQQLSASQDFSRPPRTLPFYRFDWRIEKRWNVGNRGAFWSLVAEVVNTTLNKEMISLDCSSGECNGERIGPITIPSIGAEASF